MLVGQGSENTLETTQKYFFPLYNANQEKENKQ